MRFKGEATDVQNNVGDLDGEGEDTVEERDEPSLVLSLVVGWIRRMRRETLMAATMNTDISRRTAYPTVQAPQKVVLDVKTLLTLPGGGFDEVFILITFFDDLVIISRIWDKGNI